MTRVWSDPQSMRCLSTSARRGGLDYDALARLLAADVSLASQTWSHGRFTATVLEHAALVLEYGLASCALCIAAFRNSQFDRHGTLDFPYFPEAFRDGGGPQAEQPATWLIAPSGGAAMATQRYLHVNGIDPDKLGAVAIAQRKAAARNPHATLRETISAADYGASPLVVEPLRRLDCSMLVDVAVAVLLTTNERTSAPAIYERSQ
jgi:acetyl-CoA acetyltransferase